MWSNDIYLIPITALLSMYKLKEDVHLEGDLVEGLSQLFKEYIPPNTLEVEFDLSLNDGPILDYPKGTSIGLIFMDIVRKFSFYAEIYSTSNPIVKVTLKEGRNGCPNLEP